MTQTMTTSEASILAAIRRADHPLTSRELQVRASVSETGARVCTGMLAKRGLIEPRRGGWVMSASGRAFAASSRGQRVLDVPVVARG